MFRIPLLFTGLALSYLLSSQTIPSFQITVNTASSGYYVLLPIRIGPGSAQFAPCHLLLDSTGSVIYYRPFPQGSNSSALELQANGYLTYTHQNKFYLLDSTFMAVDSVRCKNGIIQDGHDMRVMSNGHFLLMGWENEVMDLSGYALFNGNGTPGSATALVRCGVIQEQDEAGNVVFTWRARDHFAFDDVDPLFLTDPNNVDWTHFNAVEEDSDGNILVSVRHFNEITKIDRSTGAVIWRLGGHANEFAFVNDTSGFKAQHAIRRLVNGNITLLDNGGVGPPLHPVAAKEYQLDEDAHTATLVWSHAPDPEVFSSAIGNVQRLPNGLTLIDYGMAEGINAAFEVVDPSGTPVFRLQFDDTLRTYRAFNYPTWPWDLGRPTITCTGIAGATYLDAGDDHASYLWSNGATSQLVPVEDTGSYSVFVPRGEGFIRSFPLHVTSLQDPCGTQPNGISEPSLGHPAIITTEELGSLMGSGGPQVQAELFSALGESLGAINNSNTTWFVALPPGVYYVRLRYPDHTVVMRYVRP